MHITYSLNCLNPLTPMSDQDRNSPYNINTILCRQVMRIKKNISQGIFQLTQYQILQTNITRTVWHIVGRITNEILGVKGLIVNTLILMTSVTVVQVYALFRDCSASQLCIHCIEKMLTPKSNICTFDIGQSLFHLFLKTDF